MTTKNYLNKNPILSQLKTLIYTQHKAGLHAKVIVQKLKICKTTFTLHSTHIHYITIQ